MKLNKNFAIYHLIKNYLYELLIYFIENAIDEKNHYNT